MSDVAVAPLHCPSTTLPAVPAGIGAEVNVPALEMNVPDSDESAAVGVSAPVVRLRPQTRIVTCLPAIAVLAGLRQGLPGVAAPPAHASSTTNEIATGASDPRGQLLA